MSAKAVVVFDIFDNPIAGAEPTIGPGRILPLTNADGYSLNPTSIPPQETYIKIFANGYKPYLQKITLDNQNQEIHIGGNPSEGQPNTIHLPALSFRKPSPTDTPFHTAFCIPDVFTDIPFGDGKRIYTPAFACYDFNWKQRIINQLRIRNYKWLIYQISGYPYGTDYPYIPLNVDSIIQDLSMIQESGLNTIICFEDDTENLNYLKSIASLTQNLVDCCMGIFEVDGVLNHDPIRVLNVLKQQKGLYPKAINAFHSTAQNNGDIGFGEKPFWDEACKYVDVYFLQQKAWDRPLADVADRAKDFCERLMNGVAGWPILSGGVVLAEETTTATYHLGWTEQQAIDTMNKLMNMISPRPLGFLDGGTV